MRVARTVISPFSLRPTTADGVGLAGGEARCCGAAPTLRAANTVASAHATEKHAALWLRFSIAERYGFARPGVDAFSLTLTL